ncbi:sulfotransferase domain-containing protein [Geobacillus sp. Geo 8.1]
MKLDFICVGAQKSGTTTLHDILIQHRDVYLPSVKETKFFQDNEKFSKGLAYYEKEFFSDIQNETVIGEIDPEYMYFEYVPKRIYDCFGKDIKIIFLLRNPVKRAYSHYLMSYRRGYEKERFEKAIELEEKRISKGEFERNHFSYIDRGFYAKQIKNYLSYFPKKNMKFIIFEEFIKDIPSTLKEIYKFLNIKEDPNVHFNIKSNPARMPRSKFVRDFIYDPDFLKPVKKVGRIFFPTQNSRDTFLRFINRLNQKEIKNPKLDESVEKDLEKLFEPDIKELEKIIGRDLDVWRSS